MIFLQNITTLDFAYLCPERGLLGDSFHVHVDLHGELNEIGFVMDFGPAKRLIKQVIDDQVDHKVIVPGGSANIEKTGFSITTSLGETYRYEAPASSYLVLPGSKVTEGGLSAFLETACRAVLPKNVRSIKIHLQTDPRFSHEANFRYTHGLRRHNGNCQRLLHGHRNPIVVHLQDLRSPELELFLAQELEGAHFAHATTLSSTNLNFVLDRRNFNLKEHGAEIAYVSDQGEFRALLPADRIILLSEEPSIENIAKFCWQRIQDHKPVQNLSVTAFEGLNKGARYFGN